jgi:[ribosomal protein S18]-alanine N-acetyltransferase
MTLSPALNPSSAESEICRIRPMQEGDLDQVQAIDRLSFSLPWPASAFRYELKENPNSGLWIAEVSATDVSAAEASASELPALAKHSRVAGMIVVWRILDEAHIATLAVDPAERRRGIAKQLLAVALIDSIERGARLATLEVRAGNLAAQKLYFAFGFSVVGSRPKYYKDNNEDALIMTISGLGPEYVGGLQKRTNQEQGGAA